MSRTAGATNLNKRKLLSLLRDEMGPNWHPVLKMAKMAEDPDNSAEFRGMMYYRVAEFTVPKLKAVEVTGEDGGPMKMQFSWGQPHD